MENIFEEIKKIIEEYDSIVVFRHVRADYDAYGSQLGLKNLIKLNYPNKKVYTYGKNYIDDDTILEKMDDISDDVVTKSLGIVVDCATPARIDNPITLQAKELVCIDHHADFEEFADLTYIDSDASSASQLICELAQAINWKLNDTIANQLYAGMMTDTLQFSIDKVDNRLFKALEFISRFNIDAVKVTRACYDKTYDEYVAYHSLANSVVFDGDIAYLYIDLKTQRKMFLSSIKAKDQIDLMKNIKGVEKWLLFVENKENDYSCSLRSHEIPINHIANKFGGGGHMLASGIPHLSYEDTKIVIKMMLEEGD